jgi:hypothetical protein
MADEVCSQTVRLVRKTNMQELCTTYRRKGKPKPSLAPASDEMISRSARGTNLSAKGPLATACDKIGSVQVTQDPITSAAKKESLGTVMRMHKLVQIHMMVITGRRQIAISFHRVCWYLAGSWNPAMTSCTPITIRHIPYRMLSRVQYWGFVNLCSPA